MGPPCVDIPLWDNPVAAGFCLSYTELVRIPAEGISVPARLDPTQRSKIEKKNAQIEDS